MRVLVTGASGFAGSHIALFLAQNGLEVTVISRSGLFNNLDILEAEYGFSGEIHRVKCDLKSKINIATDFDLVIHAAATSAWPGISEDTINQDNVLATRHLLEFSQSKKVRRFVFLSSISVYGKISTKTLDENTKINEPDVYGASKLICETDIAATSNLSYVFIRLPAVIGKFSRRNWISEITRKFIEDPEVSYFNPETYFNNLIHIDDLCRLILKITLSPEKQYGPIVVGSNEPITSREVVRLLCEGISPGKKIIETIKDHPSFLINFQRASDIFSFEPMTVKSALSNYVASLNIDNTS